jgi:hypothetical protein
MTKIVLNVSINKFILRLILVVHIFITSKLQTDYIKIFNNLVTRFLFVCLIVILTFYDIISCVLAGAVLIFSNIEYIERKKAEAFNIYSS